MSVLQSNKNAKIYKIDQFHSSGRKEKQRERLVIFPKSEYGEKEISTKIFLMFIPIPRDMPEPIFASFK